MQMTHHFAKRDDFHLLSKKDQEYLIGIDQEYDRLVAEARRLIHEHDKLEKAPLFEKEHRLLTEANDKQYLSEKQRFHDDDANNIGESTILSQTNSVSLRKEQTM